MIAYLDLPSGISGDMFLGCLIDAGWSIETLRESLATLHLPGEEYALTCESVMKGPLRATQVSVDVRITHHRRTLPQIQTIIDSASLPQPAKDRALAIFIKLAEAEAKVHGTSIDEVHFHEVGAVDAIVDIVGAAAGIEALGIERVYASAVPLGEGWVQTAHGMLPLPAPATLELLAAAQAPTRNAPGPGELVTPTGAAILAALATFTQPAMALHRIAIGAGRKQFPWPNVARMWLGEPVTGGPIVQIDTNIDDMNPQLYGPVVERCFTAGAVDVWLTPVQMKKGRPGTVLSLLAPVERERALAELLIRETTTLGVRVHAVQRHEAQRSMATIMTPLGGVRVKLKSIAGHVVSATPEFDDCRRIADEQGVPTQQVLHVAAKIANDAWPAKQDRNHG